MSAVARSVARLASPAHSIRAAKSHTSPESANQGLILVPLFVAALGESLPDLRTTRAVGDVSEIGVVSRVRVTHVLSNCTGSPIITVPAAPVRTYGANEDERPCPIPPQTSSRCSI